MSFARHDLDSPAIGSDLPAPASGLRDQEYSSSDSYLSESSLDASSYEFDSDPEDPHRANKYDGPRSTWMDWTANERAISHGVDEAIARDLSVHLYNSHRLEIDVPPTADASDADRPWKPPKSWTAWPLPADEVPREDEERANSYMGEPTLRHPGDPSSRQILEDVLIATVSKGARQRFYAREAAPRPATSALISRMAPQPITGAASGPDPIISRSDADVNVSSNSSPGSEQSASASEQHPISSPDLVPYPLDDDEEISSLLRQPARHLLTQLDNLLTALHHSRTSYKQLQYDSGSDNDDLSADGDTASSRSQDERQASRGRSRSRSRAGSRRPGARTQSCKSKTRSRGSSSSRQSIASLRRADLLRLGLRGWDDVLGFAGSAGWNGDVLVRARARCEQLFGESSKFNETMDYFESANPVLESEEGLEDSRPRERHAE